MSLVPHMYMFECVVVVNWLDHNKTLREQSVDVNETLLLRRKYFFSDQNVDARDPVQLNLLYVQVSVLLCSCLAIVPEILSYLTSHLHLLIVFVFCCLIEIRIAVALVAVFCWVLFLLLHILFCYKRFVIIIRPHSSIT